MRRRFRFNTETQRMEEVGADWTDAERRAQTATEELVYGKLGTATDGVPINSRRKHREYMKATGTTLTSDFTETWAKAAKQREAESLGNFDNKERRETIGRALHESRRRK